MIYSCSPNVCNKQFICIISTYIAVVNRHNISLVQHHMQNQNKVKERKKERKAKREVPLPSWRGITKQKLNDRSRFLYSSLRTSNDLKEKKN